MNIEYLQQLRDNPTRKGKEIDFTIEPISLTEIENLEILYNASNPFPKALKELLFLAGAYCYVLDYGMYNNQKEIQEAIRSDLDFYNKSINRPFFAIDIDGGDQFLFVYLDEGDNPHVYSAELYVNPAVRNPYNSLQKKLSEFIAYGVNEAKKGFNPF